ncbi:hypothetical protein [Streptomyces sp. NRRL WC-3744]|uniref:hypothetical protein n=1 Tax=Streptomyces sp. NRRL WC-3744 TaxID=1463935 RepID=UPI00131C4206|nr:hypothetical protein [Streptomyces sp. NRRL WC-3744]
MAFADRVFGTIRKGASVETHDGQRVRLTDVPSIRPAKPQVDRLHMTASAAAGHRVAPGLRKRRHRDPRDAALGGRRQLIT